MNFGFRQHAVCTTSDGGAGSNTLLPVATQLTFAGLSPIVAIYSPGGAVALVACRGNGDGTWTATFWSKAATTFDVYIFDQMSACPPSGSRSGFQAFNAQGVLIADSAIRFLNVLGFASGALSGMNEYTQQWSFGVGRVATVVGVSGYVYLRRNETVPGQHLGNYQTMLSAWHHAGGTAQMVASISTSRIIPVSNPILATTYPNWSGVFVDVSNL